METEIKRASPVFPVSYTPLKKLSPRQQYISLYIQLFDRLLTQPEQACKKRKKVSLLRSLPTWNRLYTQIERILRRLKVELPQEYIAELVDLSYPPFWTEVIVKKWRRILRREADVTVQQARRKRRQSGKLLKLETDARALIHDGQHGGLARQIVSSLYQVGLPLPPSAWDGIGSVLRNRQNRPGAYQNGLGRRPQVRRFRAEALSRLQSWGWGINRASMLVREIENSLEISKLSAEKNYYGKEVRCGAVIKSAMGNSRRESH